MRGKVRGSKKGEMEGASTTKETSAPATTPKTTRGRKKLQSPRTSPSVTPHSSPSKAGDKSPARPTSPNTPSKKPKAKGKSPAKKSRIMSTKVLNGIPKNNKPNRAAVKRQETEERRQTEALEEMVNVVKGAVNGGSAALEAKRATMTLTPIQQWCGVIGTRVERMDEEVCF